MKRASLILENSLTKEAGNSYLLNQPISSLNLSPRKNECLYYLL